VLYHPKLDHFYALRHIAEVLLPEEHSKQFLAFSFQEQVVHLTKD
jgi:hypothetical protein